MLAILHQAGRPLTVMEVADAVRLSIATTRFHLNRLEADGQIRSEREPRAHLPGRPRTLYTARRPEAVDAGIAYRQLAGLLAEQLLNLTGSTGALAAGRRWAELISTESGPGPSAETGRPGRNDVDRIVRLLDESGFSPQLVNGSSGEGAQIELHTCPFLELAKDRSEVVCTVHLGLVRGLLPGSGEEVRVKAVLDGSGPCLIRLAA